MPSASLPRRAASHSDRRSASAILAKEQAIVDQNIIELDESEMERCARRLQALDVNPEGVEVVLHLREQVLALQARVRQLEAELEDRRQTHVHRLTLFRETYAEASWRDAGDEKE